MRKEEENFVSSNVIEGMNSIRAIIFAMQTQSQNDRRISYVFYDMARKEKNMKTIAWLRHRGDELGFEVQPTDTETISSMCTGQTHGGIIACVTERTIPRLKEAKDIKSHGFYVMTDGIEDPYNFGYALRSLYACGVDGVVLPERNWMSASGVVARASAGASEYISLYTSDAEAAVDFFHKKGYTVVCADTDTDDVLQRTSLPYPVFLIVGGEKRGISGSVKAKTDKIVKINYGRDFDAALSAASAATILAYEISKQNLK